ncbi:hypothetical protein QLL95_gp0605 [Cotonvirus japonicus]|uniref:Uncharacterized protein n=1 Tax=Cotonvirus japonicus TaxID=2811091 RepID=A0ABM7NTL4_9VIRU|nr:hypothetical protein QLL95_gp0605 [Cotonvirus japonicus]BCS83518.1 hypothetical protein [Cotonvirus japonicus]
MNDHSTNYHEKLRQNVHAKPFSPKYLLSITKSQEKLYPKNYSIDMTIGDSSCPIKIGHIKRSKNTWIVGCQIPNNPDQVPLEFIVNFPFNIISFKSGYIIWSQERSQEYVNISRAIHQFWEMREYMRQFLNNYDF